MSTESVQNDWEDRELVEVNELTIKLCKRSSFLDYTIEHAEDRDFLEQLWRFYPIQAFYIKRKIEQVREIAWILRSCLKDE